MDIIGYWPIEEQGDVDCFVEDNQDIQNILFCVNRNRPFIQSVFVVYLKGLLVYNRNICYSNHFHFSKFSQFSVNLLICTVVKPFAAVFVAYSHAKVSEL